MRILQFLFFAAFAATFCYGSINIDAKKFGYSKGINFKNDPAICSVKASCEPILHNATCFGTVLPYHLTSVALADDSITQFDVQDNLAMLAGLRSIPRCWAVVQPLLCATYMPKCENGSVSLPSQEMCTITRGPCRFVEGGLPSFLRCDNEKLFSSRCRNPLKEIKFNTTSKCMAPLTETENEENWFHEVEKCGLQCQDPFFSKQEHEDFQYYMNIFWGIDCVLTVLAVFTLIRRRKWESILFINMCLALVNIGYLIQFSPGAREQIVCNSDGTIRRHQPKSEGTLCVFTFILTYYFHLAALIWITILSYEWYITLRDPGSGKTKETLKKKKKKFHLAAWCLPVILTVAIILMNQVDGDSMRGICFVGFSNIHMRLFWLVPMLVAMLVTFVFIVRVLKILIRAKWKSCEMTDVHQRKTWNNCLKRIGLTFVVLLFITINEIACCAYDFAYQNEWMESLRNYIVCRALPGEPMKCLLKSKPSMVLLTLQSSNLCSLSCVMVSWVMERASLESWKRFLHRLCSPDETKAKKMKKHELIAKAFQKRLEINEGHFSLSLNTSYDDPVGMNLSSAASVDISNSWVRALPKLMTRRNALTGSLNLKCSSTSDVSRHSYDSLSNSEQDVPRHERRRKKRKRFVKDWFKHHRRGSDTSLQSSLETASVVVEKVTKSTSTSDLGFQTTMSHPVPSPNPPNIIQREEVPQFIPSRIMHGMDGSWGTHPILDWQGVSHFGANPLWYPGMYPANSWAGCNNNAFHFAFGQSAYGAIHQNRHSPVTPPHLRVASVSDREYLPIVMSDSDTYQDSHGP